MHDDETTVEQRAAVHSVLGDPARLAIVDHLAVSDRSPAELGELVAVSPSLLTHHLDALERVGLVSRNRSAGDGRRRYVTLHESALRSLTLRRMTPRRPVLFVCTRNAARSQLAAALWIERVATPAFSAGTHPAEHIHPGAVAAAERAGLNLSTARPSKVDQSAADHHIITVCDMAHEDLPPEITNAPTSWHWSIAAPGNDSGDDAYDRVIRDLEQRIATITTKPPPPSSKDMT